MGNSRFSCDTRRFNSLSIPTNWFFLLKFKFVSFAVVQAHSYNIALYARNQLRFYFIRNNRRKNTRIDLILRQRYSWFAYSCVICSSSTYVLLLLLLLLFSFNSIYSLYLCSMFHVFSGFVSFCLSRISLFSVVSHSTSTELELASNINSTTSNYMMTTNYKRRFFFFFFLLS